MSDSFKNVLKNFSYTFTSQMSSFIINALIVLILPKVIGVNDYGFFQYYLLLSTYALYFHFGWCDGIYLRYVGMDWKSLDKKILSSQFWGLMSLTIFIILTFLIAMTFFELDSDKLFILRTVIFSIIILNPKIYCSVVLQATNRLKEYAIVIITEKLTFALVLSILLLLGIRNYRILILSDIIGKFCSALYGYFCCKDIIKTAFTFSKKIFFETFNNLKVGIFLLVSNISSLLITGIIQFAIENHWDIATFSKISLTFNISKLLLVVINAMGLVLIPVLKHIDRDNLKKLYLNIRSIIMILLIGLLLLYFPLRIVLINWLPEYKESVVYAALVFPICLFESKTSLLLNTYLKALRKEKHLCLINIFVVILSIFLTSITVYCFDNLYLSVLCIPTLLAIRCILLEIIISKEINVQIFENSLVEVIVSVLFVFCAFVLPFFQGLIIYFLIYIIYLFFNKNKVIKIFKFIKNKFEY